MSLFPFDDDMALAIASEHGTPCFAYRAEIARNSFRRLKAALPPRVRLAYAVKSNPFPGLLASFEALGASFDCASDGELLRLKAMDVRGDRILFAGPGKTGPEIELAMEMGARIQVDGIEDIEKIASIAARHGIVCGVNARIHPRDMPGEGSNIIGGSNPSAFGVDEEDMASFFSQAARFRGVRIRGIQVFSASNELDADRLLEKHRITLNIAEAASGLGVEVEEIDLGGGLGIPYGEGEGDFDCERLGSGLGNILEENRWFGGNLVIEPGRFLSGPAGAYLARVTRMKSSRGELFAVLEGGINHLARPLLVGKGFPARAPGTAGEPVPVTFAGPLCTSLDRLGKAMLPALRPGDLVMFGQAGAYGFTESMQLFLSRKPPKEILV